MQRFARSKSISLIINKADGAWESNPIANDCIVQSNVQTINPRSSMVSSTITRSLAMTILLAVVFCTFHCSLSTLN